MKILEKIKSILKEKEIILNDKQEELCEAINDIMINDNSFIHACIEAIHVNNKKKNKIHDVCFILKHSTLNKYVDWVDENMFVMIKPDIIKCMESLGFESVDILYDVIPSLPGTSPRGPVKRYCVYLEIRDFKLN